MIPTVDSNVISQSPIDSAPWTPEFFLTNRELSLLVAWLVWVAVAVLSTRRGDSSGRVLTSLRDVASSIANKKILLPVIVYLCWISAALVAADAVGLWDMRLAKAAAIWLLLAGLGLFGVGIEAVRREGAIVGAAKRLLGVAVVFEFVANAASFPLTIEMPAQIIAVPCAFVWGWGSSRQERSCAAKLAFGYLQLLGAGALVWGITHLVSEGHEIDWGLYWRELILPLWLTPVALAYMALLALYMSYEATFSVMSAQSAAGFSWRHRLAVMLRCGPRLRAIRAARPTAPWLANEAGFLTTWKWTGRVLREDRKQRADEAARVQRLEDNAGIVGTDATGRQLDQREHEETMEALRWLYTCHLGHYRREGDRYFAGLEAIVDSLSDTYGLPRPNNIEMHVSDDGQSWYAARQTITGHWFAIGAAGPPTDQWFYDGPTAPSGYPSETEWDQWVPDHNAANWD